jgi:polysaccharide deacetylase family protein (PEP-CTERM system associated)
MKPAPAPARLANALTVDVEDYFQVSAFAPYIARSSWNEQECRVERNMARILDLFESRQVKATFFVLGWIAERYPHLVREVAQRGHEVASHGYGHQRASDLDRNEFLADVLTAKHVLEDLTGQAVTGYRAPSFSIGKQNLWAFEALRQAGYRYSSSVYPIAHDHYGMPDAPRHPYSPHEGLLEIPVTTLRLFGKNLPASGGGYFRLLPFPLSRWMLDRVNATDEKPGIFYFHPWEIDADQPRVAQADAKSKFRHYVNVGRMESKLSSLLDAFNWNRVDTVYQEWMPESPAMA